MSIADPFADLIPKPDTKPPAAAPASSGNEFRDLIPKAGGAQTTSAPASAGSQGAFADLVPAAGDDKAEVRGMPPVGAMSGKLHLDPSLAPQVPAGAPRPLAPGEYIRNPSGSWSSEITATVEDKRLNGGKPTVIPTLWLIDGKPYRLTEDQAVDAAVKSGLDFQSFPDLGAADKFTTQREAKWQKVQPANASSVAPLWQQQPRRGLLEDIPLQAVGGVRDAVQQMLNLTARAGHALNKLMPLGSIEIGPHGLSWTKQYEAAPPLPEVPQASTKTGSLVRGVAQFATGMIPAVRAAKLLKIAAGAEKLASALGASEKVAKAAGFFAGQEGASQIANQIAFDPHGQRLSNLVERFPDLSNPVTRYLESKPGDTEAEARLKTALEGLALGTAIPSVLASAKRLRVALRSTRRVSAPLALPAPDTTITVDRRGSAMTAVQAREAERANAERQASRADLGLTPDVEAAQMRREAAAREADLAKRAEIEAQQRAEAKNAAFDQAEQDRERYAELRAEAMQRAGQGNVMADALLRAEALSPRLVRSGETMGPPEEIPPLHPEAEATASTPHGPDLSPAPEPQVAEPRPPSPTASAAISRLPNNSEEAGKGGAPDFSTAGVGPQSIAGAKAGTSAGNIKLNKLRSPGDVKAAITQTAKEFAPQFEGARRGVVSEQQTRKLASDLDMTTDTLLKRRLGQAFSAEQALAARRLLIASGNDLADKAKAAVGGSDEALLAFQQALHRHAGIQAQVTGMTAEAGRALRQFRMTAAGSRRAEAIRSAIETHGGRSSVEELAREVSKIDTPEGLNRFARQAVKVKTSDRLLEVWINSLLSGPQTHVVNALSNALVAGWTLPEHLLAAGFGALRKGADKVYGREVLSRAFGAVQGMRDGMRVAAKTFMTEEPSDLLSKIETSRYKAIPSLKLRAGMAKKKLAGIPIPFSGEIELGGKQIRLPGRALQASDEFFKALGYRMELNAQAMRDGISRGLKGRALAEHINDVLNNPPDDIAKAALDNARYQTFTQPLGRFGQAVTAMASSHPIVRLVFPFIRTPTNIAKFALERSPFGLMMKEVRDNLHAGGATRDIQLARMAFGSGVGALIAQLAAEGHVTGGGPTDPIARGALYATGWQPYSVKIGDRYYSYSRLEPLGTILGVSADLSDISGEVEQGQVDHLAGQIVGSISKNLTSKTFLRGASELINAFSDPDRYGTRYVESMLGTLIPTGVAQYARAKDPVLRDTQGVIDELKSRIPGYSETLPARRNLWGQPIILGGGVGPDLISPVYSSIDKHDPVSEEFMRLGVRIGLPNRIVNVPQPDGTTKPLKLNPKQYSRYVEEAGQSAKVILDRVVADPGYAHLPDEARRAVFEGIIRRTRDAARQVILRRVVGRPVAPESTSEPVGANQPQLTPADRASPIPNALIQRGKQMVSDALARYT